VDGKFRTEGGDASREILLASAQPVDPESKRGARGGEEALPLFGLQLVRQRDGREPGRVQDLVGIGIADAADKPGIGEGALQGAILGSECGAEAVDVCREDFDAAGIDVERRPFFTAQNVKRRAALACRLGQDERTGREVEGGKALRPASFAAAASSAAGPRSSEVQHQPQVAVSTDRMRCACRCGGWRRRCAFHG
jgi:hypothetical protein